MKVSKCLRRIQLQLTCYCLSIVYDYWVNLLTKVFLFWPVSLCWEGYVSPILPIRPIITFIVYEVIIYLNGVDCFKVT